MKKGAVGSGTCPACKKECRVINEDCGIGAYEYWGARGVHHDWRQFSDCCGEDMGDAVWEPWEPDVDNYREDR